MIVTLKPGAEVSRVLGELAARGLWVSALQGAPGEPALLLVAPHSAQVDPRELGGIEGVLEVAAPKPQHPRVTAQRARVVVAGVPIGGGAEPVWMCGPCSVESEQHARELAEQLQPLGVRFLRGGAFKPRTSPYAFQGLGAEGLKILADARAETGLPIVTELTDLRDIDQVVEYADCIQVGARNMQHFPLLTELGRAGLPVLLKRGMGASIDDFLLAAEYILTEGNQKVVLCERGIHAKATPARSCLDLAAVTVLKEHTHLPVIVDPSHAAGRRALVEPLALAAAACGADGLIVECHPDPRNARCDGPQAITLEALPLFATRVRAVAQVAAGAPA